MNLMVIILLCSLFLAAFFSGVEAAFVSSDKLRLEIQKQSGPFRYALVKMITRTPGMTSVTIRTGMALSLVFFCVSAASLLQPLLIPRIAEGWLLFILLTLILFTVFILFGISLPKAVSVNYADSLISNAAVPFSFFYFIFYPFTGLVILLIRSLSKRSYPHDKLRDRENRILTMEDLGHLVKEEEQLPGKAEKKLEKEVILFRNALDFSKVKLHEIMVPRNEIAVLNINSDVETLREKFISTGYSRILFYEDNKDNIIGYVHTSAIFQKARSIKPFLKNVLVVPETMAANRLLSKFIREHRSIALVVDEFGGTAGLVTIEDILEEIFGEIEDEYDSSGFIEKKISENQYILSGRIEIDVLNEKYQLDIEESDEYETLAGFILFHHESIPKPGTMIKIDRFNIKILKATPTKIELVQFNII